VLSNALKIADKVTIALEAVGEKIRVNSQGWEDARIIAERQVIMVVAYKGQIYLLASTGRRSSGRSIRLACARRAMGLKTSDE
jgi:hypothetical protein